MGQIQRELTGIYQVFELVRKESAGGGLAIGAKNDLQPVWVSEGDDFTEVLVIQVTVGEIIIRCVGAYGLGCPIKFEVAQKNFIFCMLLPLCINKSNQKKLRVMRH